MGEDDIRALAGQMTLEEQVSLLSGEDFWSLPAIARLGIHKLRVTDGPNGARGSGQVTAAAFPCGIAVGATWNVALARELGAALAEEVKSKGAHVALAPTVNIQRSVTSGRNFECYSEDPVLTAQLAVGTIEGLQGEGVAATVKHFVGNDSEFERRTISAVIDERTLREIYLLPFEQAVKAAGTWGVMASYNRLNGTFTAEHAWLLTTVLREEWRYDGVVMSDWFGSHTTAATLNAGLDIEMPGPPRDRGQKLVDAVRAGDVPAATVRERALNVLRLAARTGAIDDERPHEEIANDRPADRALIRRAAAEAMVLLRNEGGILPLDPARVGRIAVIGPNAREARIMGGGSAQLNAHYAVSPWEGLARLFGEDRLVFAPGAANNRFVPRFDARFEATFFNSPDLSGAIACETTQDGGESWVFPPPQIADGEVWSARYTTHFTPPASGDYEVGVFATVNARIRVDGVIVADAWGDKWVRGPTFFEQGCEEATGHVRLEAGRSHAITLEIGKKPSEFAAFRMGMAPPPGENWLREAVETARNADIAIVCAGRNGEWDTEGGDLAGITLPGGQDALVRAVAEANPRTIVVLQTGGPVEMPWLGQVAAVLEAWYPGQEAGNAIADVIAGLAEPGGRLPQTFPVRWRDNPTHSQDSEVYPGLGGKVRYEEGVFVGYRHYDRHGIAPLFPFGFGLGYTNFELDGLTLDTSRFDGGEAIVEAACTLINTGARAGSTVVQLYVGDTEASLARPARELKAFAKLRLEPGASARLHFTLEPRAFAFYSPTARHWVVEPGSFSLQLGFSAADIRLTGEVRRGTKLLIPV